MSGEDVQRLAGVFQSEVLKPMLAAATEHPGGVRTLIAALREKLDALDFVLNGYDASPFASTAGANGQDGPLQPSCASDGAAQDLDEIGRNQRSRLREMVLLEMLSTDARPFALLQLMKALEERGFADGSAAIVSQLHRMKKLGLIEQPANGMYEVTQDGLGHLRKLRASFGGLIKGESRATVR